MKTLIRKGIFETNSSGSHSLHFDDTNSKNCVFDTLIPDENGVLEVYGMKFSWQKEFFDDAFSKISYLFLDNSDDLTSKHDIIARVICENCPQIKKVKFTNTDGYIDNQSTPLTEELFEGNFKEKLKNFIFNSLNCIETGNDNG